MGLAHELTPVYNPDRDLYMRGLLVDIRRRHVGGFQSTEATPRGEWTRAHPYSQERVKYLLSEGFDVCEEPGGLTISWANAGSNPNHKGVHTCSPIQR